MKLLLLTVAIGLAACETCIRFLKNRDERRLFQTIPGRVWRWNRVTRAFEQIEAVKMNGSLACSVEMASDLRGRTIVAGIDIMHPYVSRKPSGIGVTGFIGDTWTTLEEALGFNVIAFAGWGHRTRNLTNFPCTTYTTRRTIYRKAGPSASQTLMNGQAHALLLATVIYSDTSGYYAYSTPITAVSYSLFVRSDGSQVSQEWYANVFSRGLWLTIFAFVLGTTVTIAGVYYSKKIIGASYAKHDHEFSSTSFNLLAVLGSLSGQGCQKIPRSWPLRFLVLSHLITGMLLSAGFSSTLTSYLAIRGNSVPLTSLEDALQKRSHSVCVRNDSSAYIRFTVDGSPNGPLKEEWKNLLNGYCPDMRNSSGLESRLCAPGFAYLEVPDVFLPIYRPVRHVCRIVEAARHYWALKISFLHARFSEHRRLINLCLIRLHSAGILKYLERKWMPKGIQRSQVDRSGFRAVEYAHVHSLLLGFVCATVASLLICLLENVWHALRSERSSKLSALDIPARSLRLDVNARPTRIRGDAKQR